MKTLKVIGAGMMDEIFATDPAIHGEEICWNVTRLRAAAAEGKFGQPHRRAMASLPPMTKAHHANIDWGIVHSMVARHKTDGDKSILLEPSIVVTVRVRGELHRIIADGNKRISARRLLGLGTWDAFIVAPEDEKHYRVLMLEGEGEH